jgi:phosphoglycerate kinase
MEIEKFSQGSVSLAKLIAKTNAKIIISGDSTIKAIQKAGVESKITHISLGGEATRELLEGKSLPAVKALTKDKEE